MWETGKQDRRLVGTRTRLLVLHVTLILAASYALDPSTSRDSTGELANDACHAQ